MYTFTYLKIENVLRAVRKIPSRAKSKDRRQTGGTYSLIPIRGPGLACPLKNLWESMGQSRSPAVITVQQRKP